MRGRRPEADPRFTPHVSRFLEAGRARCRWQRIARRSRTVHVGQAPRRLRKISVYTQYAVGILHSGADVKIA